MGAKNAKTFEACPYCLTEVGVIQPRIMQKEEHFEETFTDSSASRNVAHDLTFAESVETKPSACKRHLGYLSQRSPKEKIPEECMTCDKIVQCMLQMVKS